MRLSTCVAVVVAVSLLLVADAVAAEKANKVLAGVKTVQVDETVVPNPSKGKEDHAGLYFTVLPTRLLSTRRSRGPSQLQTR